MLWGRKGKIMITIKVPATTANIGPGFDSLGMAVTLYLELDILEETDAWVVEHDIPYLPTDERNLIVQIAKRVDRRIKPHRLRMRTTVPTTRGLGSSSTAIVAGIELANCLGDLQLSVTKKIKLATKFEGHPDNVAPAIVGNLVVSAAADNQVFWSKIRIKGMKAIACVPETPLSTKESRGVLPETLTLAQAAKGSAISNVVVSKLAKGYLRDLKRIIERDVFHEPYRNPLVPELSQVRQLLAHEKTYGTYLSGAGPTVMTLVPVENSERIQQLLETQFPQHTIYVLDIDTQGVQIIEN